LKFAQEVRSFREYKVFTDWGCFDESLFSLKKPEIVPVSLFAEQRPQDVIKIY
jgi:hypothetical protein